jgi:hypothetical protein
MDRNSVAVERLKINRQQFLQKLEGLQEVPQTSEDPDTPILYGPIGILNIWVVVGTLNVYNTL